MFGSIAGCISRSNATIDYSVRVYTEVDQERTYSLQIHDMEANELVERHRGGLTGAGDDDEYSFRLEEGHYDIWCVLDSGYVNSHTIELLGCEESEEQGADVAVWDDYSVTFQATQCPRSASIFD